MRKFLTVDTAEGEHYLSLSFQCKLTSSHFSAVTVQLAYNYSPGVDNAALAMKGLDLDHTPLSEGIIVWLYARKSALASDQFKCGHTIWRITLKCLHTIPFSSIP